MSVRLPATLARGICPIALGQTIYVKNKDFDLSEQVVQCILSFEDAWEDKQIELETDIEENVRIYSIYTKSSDSSTV